MLFQVGGEEGARPTFFEMAAAAQLPSSLRAALLYSMGVIAQRRLVMHRVLDYSDEAFALLMLVLEAHNLRSTDASFAESLYGLRRRPTCISESRGGEKKENNRSGLTRKQRRLSLLFLVGLPYLKSKLHTLYLNHRGYLLQAALWDTGSDGMMESDTVTSETFVPSNRTSSNAGVPYYRQLQERIITLLALCFPWVNAIHEGLVFAYQLLYLLDATPYYSPALHLLGLHVSRASGQELMDSAKHITERRNLEYEMLGGSSVLQAIRRTFLHYTNATLDFAQTGLIGAVFLVKMIEWWYQSAEERVTASAIYPPPPPPPAPKVAKDGIPLPQDTKLCPLCLTNRTNPAMISVSGYAFCYPCVFNYVSQYHRCPVTLIPSEVDNIRRLYRDA